MQISDGRLASFSVLPLLLLSVAAYGMFWSAVSCSSVVLCYLLFAAVAWLAQLMCNPEVVFQFVLMSGDCHVAGCLLFCLVLVLFGLGRTGVFVCLICSCHVCSLHGQLCSYLK